MTWSLELWGRVGPSAQQAAQEGASEGGILHFMHMARGQPATWAMGGEGSREEVLLSQGQKEPGLGLGWVEAALKS